MQKISKEEKAKKELQERLKKSALKHSSSALESNPLIAQARAMLKPNFGIGDSQDEVRVPQTTEALKSKRSIQGAEGNPESLRDIDDKFSPSVEPITQLAPNELAPNELAPNELAPNELAPNELAPNELAPNELAPNELAPNELAPNELAPNELAPNELAPNELAPNELAPNELAPNELAPNELALNELAPNELVAQFEVKLSQNPSFMKSSDYSSVLNLFPHQPLLLDFSKTEEWVQNFLLKSHGIKRYLPIKLYIEVYKRAQVQETEIVCMNRQDLAKSLQTSSNSSVTRAVRWGGEMGFFDCVSLTCRKGNLKPGTYFRVRCPWM